MITAVTVEGDGSGELTVRWEQEGDGPVEVSVGPAPDAIDHGRPVTRVDAGREATLAGLAPGRHYVAVAPAGGGTAVVAAERRIPLEGAMNFRDLGGYRTADGSRTRWGRVFRSDGLHGLTEADRRELAVLGLRTVYDLRRDVERERHPSPPLDGSVRSVVLTIGEAAEQPELLDLMLAGQITEADDDFMVEVYGKIVADHAMTFGVLLSALASPDALPALFHCTAGKDRTGVAAALLLTVLGVDESDVLDDYELSTRYRTERRIAELRPGLEAAGVDVEKVRPFLSARRPVLEATLRRIHSEHGTVEAYLLEAAGMERETLEELRRLLLV